MIEPVYINAGGRTSAGHGQSRMRGAHVWFCSPTEALAHSGHRAALAPEEIAHAERLRRADDRLRYLGARSLLRQTLSNVTSGAVPAQAWRFRAGRNGKPEIAPGLPAIAFNIAHAGDCVAVAISATGNVGIDVEPLATASLHGEAILDQLTARERALPEADASMKMLELWTRKEAVAKALALTLDDIASIDVSTDVPLLAEPSGRNLPASGMLVSTLTVTVGATRYALSTAVIQNL